MKIVYIEPNKVAEIRDIEAGLESMQAIVGGNIQAIYPYDDPVALICNDEGKIYGLDLNRGLRDYKGELYDIIAGTFFVCLADPDSPDFEGLTDRLANKYVEIFKCPELFMRVNGKIESFKCD